MAPKRSAPSDQPPPSVSSSEDDVEGTEGEEEEEEVVEGNKQEEEDESSEEEESGEEDEEEEEDNVENPPKPIQSSVKIPTSNSNQANAEDDDENDESGSDSGSDSDNEPVKHMIAPRNLDAKPISSKPMVETPKSKKPTSSTAASVNVKRPLETESNEKDSKRDRKKKKIADITEEKGNHIEDSEKKSGEEKKAMPLFQRVFSEKDEIELLNGLLEYKKKGHRISNSMNDEFLEFVKGSLQFQANLSQLNNKIQRLNKKYKRNMKRAKPGLDPVISNPHELRSYNLSKEIWGDQIVKDGMLEDNQSGATPGKKSKSKIKSNGVASPNPKKKMLVLPSITPKVEPKEEDSSIGSQYPYLDQSMMPQNDSSRPLPPAYLRGLAGWEVYGTSNALEFDKRWKTLILKETEAYLERVALVQEQTKWMLEFHKSSDS